MTRELTRISDDDKYTAHSALLGRTVQSNSQFQLGDKTIVSPQLVVNAIAESKGQDCKVYDGGCVNLNDNAAMSEACGSGFTLVGGTSQGAARRIA
jgi:chitinase